MKENETADSDPKRTLQTDLKYRKNAEISKEILRGEDTISLGRQFVNIKWLDIFQKELIYK